MVALKFLFGLAILIVLVVFSLNNLEPQVEIKYYIDKTLGPMPLSFALLGAAAIGSIVAALVTLIEQIKLRHTVKKQAKEIAQLESQILEFESMPPEPIPDNLADRDETALPPALPPKPDES